MSLLLIVGSTYAWITYSDERINQTKMTRKQLSLVIDESFKSELQWQPGIVTEKKVTVRNNGQIPGITRVSLYEFLLLFEVDINDGEGMGNGALKKVPTASSQGINSKKITTWQVGNTYAASDGTFIVAKEVFLSDTTDSRTAHLYQEPATVEGLTYISLHFNEAVIYDANKPPLETDADYWYYENGYFYYSEVLQPGDSTRPLLERVSLAKVLPNQYKGALYQLVPVMDGHDVSKQLLDDWQLTETVASMYDGKIH